MGLWLAFYRHLLWRRRRAVSGARIITSTNKKLLSAQRIRQRSSRQTGVEEVEAGLNTSVAATTVAHFALAAQPPARWYAASPSGFFPCRLNGTLAPVAGRAATQSSLPALGILTQPRSILAARRNAP